MTTRKMFALTLALALCLSLLPTVALAAGDFTITDGVLTEYKGSGGDVVIPQGVVAIGNKVFYECRDLTSVTIPSGVTAIGDSAFYDCSNLTSVTLPDGVTSIGDSAFAYCGNLASINIPDGVTEIGGSAFAYCGNLASINIPDSVTEIGHWAFQECERLTSITIPAGVTTIGLRAFYHCTALASVTIPEGVTQIGEKAFQYCGSLTSVTIPDSVTSIGWGAFDGCTSLTDLTLGAGLTEFGAFAFHSYDSLTSITVAPEITELPYFGEGDSLTIYGAPGSWAELWAQDNGYKFEANQPFTTTPSRTAYTSPQNVNVDGKAVTFQCYALKDENGNLTNYVKLRDLAYVLNGTQAQFQVGYSNNQVTATTETPYTANGSEMSTPFSGNRTYLDGPSSLQVDDRNRDADCFVLRDDNGGGYTYYKLRDLGKTLGFNVGWSADKGVYVETNKPYDYNN